VRWLLAHGADWRKTDKNGDAALELALRSCNHSAQEEIPQWEEQMDAAVVLRDWARQHGTATEKTRLRAGEQEWQRQVAEWEAEALASAQEHAKKVDDDFWLSMHYYRSVGSVEPLLCMEYSGDERREGSMVEYYSS
jgi:hypothetical protein